MTAGFQTFSDSNGNLWVADGWVSQLRSGVRLAAGSGGSLPPALTAPDGSRYVAAGGATAGTFVGGSGRGLVATGLTPAVSGPPVPVGIWTPARPDVWTRGIFVLTKTGSSAANISDGTNTVANLTTGAAPIGNFVATSYGQTTYNGGSAFTIAVASEEGAPGTIPTCVCNVTAGTAQAGNYAPSSAVSAASVIDSNWTIVVNSDGTADLKHAGTIMASRAGGSPYEIAGVYEANSAGMTAYNSGIPWRAFLQVIPAAPRAGFAYLTLTETAGVLTSVAGPFFATALPADSSTVFHVPVAQSDGLGGLVQLHTGLLIWSSAASASAPAWTDLTGTATAMTVGNIGSLMEFTAFQYSNSGSGSSASGILHANLGSGITAAGYGRAVFFEDLQTESGSSGTGIDCTKNYDVSIVIRCGYSTATGIVRIVLGDVGNGSTPPNGSTNAVSGRGWGMEIHHTGAGATEFRIFAHDGTTYSTTAWTAFTFGVTVVPVLIRKVGAVVSVFCAAGPNADFPTTATLTSGSIAPTTGTTTGASVACNAVSDGTGSAGTSAACWFACRARLRIY